MDISHLCSLCEAMFAQPYSEEPLPKILEGTGEVAPSDVAHTMYSRFDHHSSPSALLNSSRYCHLCALAWYSFEYKKQEEDKDHGNSRFYFERSWKQEDTYRLQLQFFVDEPSGSFWESHIEDFIGYPLKDSALQTIPRGSTTGCTESISCVARWADSCFNTHTQCKQESQNRGLPTRVLDVGSLDPDSKVCLHISDVNTRQSPYVTLSHCWGTKSIPKLSMSNLGTMQKSIDPEILPKTFRDAIEITRKLNITYLWIDSLCIIQDSAEDWEMESSIMGEVYENCVFNIAATGASGGEDGMLFTRPPLLAQPLIVIARAATPSEGEKTIPPPESLRFLLSPESIWRCNVRKATLNTRGWVLQERMLAPRTIHFTGTQLFWECGELTACETHPYGMPARTINQYSWGSGRPLKRLKPSVAALSHFARYESIEQPGKTLPASNTRLWHKIVEEYSPSLLTMEKDKLVAISGIAKRMQLVEKDEYLAGLWKKSLTYDLLWCVESPGRTSNGPIRSENYRAPSWSWASVTAQCKFLGDTLPIEEVFVRLLDSKVVSKSADITGEILTGYLKFGCWLKLFTIDRSLYDIGGFSMHGLHARFDDQPNEQYNYTKEQYLMPIVANGEYLLGIIISKTNVEHEFRRIGIFYVARRDTSSKGLKDGIFEDNLLSRLWRKLTSNKSSSNSWSGGWTQTTITLV